ncbi:UNVERIFIED_CONTAM: protein arginine N-methyltransferase 1.5, partial [Sesamum radiatum]
MPLGERYGGDKSESRYCGVETEFDDDMPNLLSFNIHGGFDFVLATLFLSGFLFNDDKVFPVICRVMHHGLDNSFDELFIRYSLLFYFRAEKMDPNYRPSQVDEDTSRSRALPFAGSDLVLSPSQWSSHVVGKISSWIDLDSEDVTLRKDSEIALKQELAWASHLSLQVVISGQPVHNVPVGASGTNADDHVEGGWKHPLKAYLDYIAFLYQKMDPLPEQERFESLVKLEGWEDIVTIVSSDMRNWDAPERADILVSNIFSTEDTNMRSTWNSVGSSFLALLWLYQ